MPSSWGWWPRTTMGHVLPYQSYPLHPKDLCSSTPHSRVYPLLPYCKGFLALDCITKESKCLHPYPENVYTPQNNSRWFIQKLRVYTPLPFTKGFLSLYANKGFITHHRCLSPYFPHWGGITSLLHPFGGLMHLNTAGVLIPLSPMILWSKYISTTIEHLYLAILFMGLYASVWPWEGLYSLILTRECIIFYLIPERLYPSTL